MEKAKIMIDLNEINYPKRIEALNAAVEEQMKHWDHSPYQLGLVNGLLVAQSILSKQELKLKEAPKEWRVDQVRFIEYVEMEMGRINQRKSTLSASQRKAIKEKYKEFKDKKLIPTQ